MPLGAIQGVPGRTFQIAAPGRPDPASWIDSWNMGPPEARRKRVKFYRRDLRRA